MTPTLYIFIRRDIPDMNPGKACAQAAHAQADFDQYMNEHADLGSLNTWLSWKQDRTFGRTLVVLATLDEIQEAVSKVAVSGITTDPHLSLEKLLGRNVSFIRTNCGMGVCRKRSGSRISEMLSIT